MGSSPPTSTSTTTPPPPTTTTTAATTITSIKSTTTPKPTTIGTATDTPAAVEATTSLQTTPNMSIECIGDTDEGGNCINEEESPNKTTEAPKEHQCNDKMCELQEICEEGEEDCNNAMEIG